MSDAINKYVATSAAQIWHDFHRTAVPTLLLWARNSFAPLGHMERVGAAIPTCSLVEIPDSTHHVKVDNPAALMDAVQAFLAA